MMAATLKEIPTITFECNDYVTEMCVIGGRLGADKSPLSTGRYRHAYTPIYHFLFASRRYESLNIAEIGIAEGRGLQLLREYFPCAALFGLEANDGHIATCRRLGLRHTSIVKTDASNRRKLQQTFGEFGCQFDLIIDDASHIPVTQVCAIESCMPYLKPGGTLIIEDVYENVEIAPASLYGAALEKLDIASACFVLPKSERTFVGGWNNEKLLVVVKGSDDLDR
jgi:SAM-dependent methyltransferase